MKTIKLNTIKFDLDNFTNGSGGNNLTPEQIEALNQVSELSQKIGKLIAIDNNTPLSEQLTEDDSTYLFTKDIDLGGLTVVVPNGCVLKFDGGKVKNGMLYGTNTQIISTSKTHTIFSDVVFDGMFVDCDLTAMNFGYVSDLHYVASHLTKKNLDIDIEKATGTNNYSAMKMAESFLNHSEYTKFEFNGEFYSEVENEPYKYDKNIIQLDSVKHIELYGGTIVHSLFFRNCHFINVHDIRFVGYHKRHEFPTRSYFLQNKSDSVWHTNSEQLQEGTSAYDFGLSHTAIMAGCINNVTNENYKKYSSNVVVENCYIEMRMSGVVFGNTVAGLSVDNIKNYLTRDCLAKNVECNHIFYQPCATHATHCVYDNIYGDYVGQPVDFSRYTNNCTARNVRFTRCCIGPKSVMDEETVDTVGNVYNNVLESCYFEIGNGDMPWDYDYTGFLITQSSEEPASKLIDCTFKMYSRRKDEIVFTPAITASTALLCGSGNLEVINCKFITENIDTFIQVSSGFGNLNISGCEFIATLDDAKSPVASGGTKTDILSRMLDIRASTSIFVNDTTLGVQSVEGAASPTSRLLQPLSTSANADIVFNGCRIYGVYKVEDAVAFTITKSHVYKNCEFNVTGSFIYATSNNSCYNFKVFDSIINSSSYIFQNANPKTGLVEFNGCVMNGSCIRLSTAHNQSDLSNIDFILTRNKINATQTTVFWLPNVLSANTKITDNTITSSANGSYAAGVFPAADVLPTLWATHAYNNTYIGDFVYTERYGVANYKSTTLPKACIGHTYVCTDGNKDVYLWNGNRWVLMSITT